MTSYAHKKLIEQIARLDKLPADSVEFSSWIKAGAHLNFLRANAASDEIVAYAAGPYSFIHSIAVPEILLRQNREALLKWSCNPYTSIASYVYGGGRDDVWIERERGGRGTDALDAGIDLIFGRTFEGWPDDGRSYFELNQEFSHLSGIHFRPEHAAYCRFDENGDLDAVVSITGPSNDESVTLVSFNWELLEQYLAMAGMALVRMFDFTLLRRGSFSGWPAGAENTVEESDRFLYRQKLAGDCAYTRGIQIIFPRRSAAEIMNSFKSGSKDGKQYAEFVAHDWRHDQVVKISTDPKATTNYFDAKENDLPYELSPAFFRPEVLSKYKADREKYTVGEREIGCRAAWHLRGYDVNEAGQIHAYICDLRSLPHAEQLHWLAHNEAPKTGISERAYTTDFQGKFTTSISSREKILSVLDRWTTKRVSWWSLRDEALLKRANSPLTTSKDEWSDAMMDLSKLVVEGFDVKPMRKALDRLQIAYGSNDQSIALLEKIVGHSNGEVSQLAGLRTVQLIRTKVKGHAGSSDAKKISAKAIAEHGSFAGHFDHTSELVAKELAAIETACQSLIEEGGET